MSVSKTLSTFENLLKYEYCATIGRSGKQRAFRIRFDKKDFMHLAGLQYLTDIRQLHGSRERIYDQISNGSISDALLESSFHYGEIKDRVELLAELESLLDDDKLVFRYNSSYSKTNIKHEYLISFEKYDTPSFFFLYPLSDGIQHGVSFFPMDSKNYKDGETKWTLLKLTKKNLNDESVQVIYTNSNFSE